MKKLFLVFVCSFAVAITSCSQDDVVESMVEKNHSSSHLMRFTTESFNYTTVSGSFAKTCNSVSLNGKSYIRLDITNTGTTTLYLNVQSDGYFPSTGLNVSLGGGSAICYDLPISGWTGKLKLEGFDSDPYKIAKGTIIASAY